MQRPIQCLFMRGGTSRGPFFRATDLPSDIATRDRVLLAVMGSPDVRQIDGLGGADPLTSKVGIVSPGNTKGVDLEFLFAQVSMREALVDTTPNCGNMLAAVVPFAIESGMVAARLGTTTLRVLSINTGTLSDIEVQTPDGRVEYAGGARIDGVPGTAAPVNISFLDTAGSVCGALFPTGNLLDRFDGIEVTCIDNGMPVVIMRAADLGATGYESRDELNANTALKARIESIRLQAGPAMKLGDVAKKVVPKMSLVAPPRSIDGMAAGHITTRTFIPHDCHSAVGVLGAVTVATAAVTPGTVANSVAQVPPGGRKEFSVQHPTGEFTVTLTMSEVNPASGQTSSQTTVERASLLRTARLIMRGEVLIPGDLWKGTT
jgi:4-oxalomesaconate tautomerase